MDENETYKNTFIKEKKKKMEIQRRDEGDVTDK